MNLENQVLGSFLVDVDACQYIHLLDIDDFQNDDNKGLFRAIYEAYKENDPIDIVSMCEVCPDCQQHIIDYADNLISTVNIENHIKKLKEKTIKENIIKLYTDTLTELKTKKADINKINGEFITNISKSECSIGTVSMKAVTKNYIDDFEKRAKESYTDILQTGFTNLDMRLLLRKGMMITLAARPGMGKTTLALNIAVNMAEIGKHILIFSFEMQPELLIEKILSSRAKINYSEIQNPKEISDGALINMTRKIKEVSKYNITFNSSQNLNIYQITQICRQRAGSGKLDLVVIDYLQLIKWHRTNANATQIVGEMSREIKLLATSLNIPIFCLSQLNREITKDNRKPRLSDLRDSGAIEQDSDVVMFIHADDVSDKEREILIAKNRNAKPNQTCNINFFGEFQSFVEEK